MEPDRAKRAKKRANRAKKREKRAKREKREIEIRKVVTLPESYLGVSAAPSSRILPVSHPY